MRAKLENLKGKWVEYLPEVLWAYITTCKSATRETPFALKFGTEGVTPVEVGLESSRVEFANAEHNEESLCLNLDLLEEKREQGLKHTEDYQRKTTRYYERKVRPNSFKLGDLVTQETPAIKEGPHSQETGTQLGGTLYRITGNPTWQL